MAVVRQPGTADWIAEWGLRLAVALGAAAALAQLLAYRFDLARGVLDSSADGGIFGPLGIVVFGAAVAAAWLLALERSERRDETVACAVLLSAILGLEAADPPHAVVVAAPIGVTAVVLLLRLAPADEPAGRLVRTGCVVVAVAFAVHAIGAWLVTELGQGSGSWAYQAKAIVKHAGELVGWTLVAAGLTSLWTTRR